ncbi:hypothetical protein SDC9_65257 [bioreactor metagenome]|uniref:Uncharacterized protein n=1 Tax=bioreactor metagenome TaxID=1076179 RepID=A0A644XRH7_9ZZZZ
MQHDAAQHLHPVGAHAKDAGGSLSDGGEGIRQDVVGCLALFEPFLQNRGLPCKLCVTHGGVFACKCVHFVCGCRKFFQLAVTVCSEYFIKKSHSMLL